MEAREQERIQKELQEIQRNFEKENNHGKKKGGAYHNKESVEPMIHSSKSPERKVEKSETVEYRDERINGLKSAEKPMVIPSQQVKNVPQSLTDDLQSQEELERSFIEQRKDICLINKFVKRNN
jgi:hypothetical protein